MTIIFINNLIPIYRLVQKTIVATGSVDNILKTILLHVKNHLFLTFF